MYETIVVGFDDSPHARSALSSAIELARGLGATVHVVTVIEPTSSPMSFDIGDVGEINQAAEELISQIVETVAVDGIEITGMVRRGKPHTELIDYADEVDADLLVVGQRGGDGLETALLGSTADRLAHVSDIPVTIVPANKEADR